MFLFLVFFFFLRGAGRVAAVVILAVYGFSLVAAMGGYSLVAGHRLLIAVASLGDCGL